MFVIRRLQELVRKKLIPLYVCFVDPTKAYDSVDRTHLWTVLARFWRATEYDLGHSSIPRWHASMRAARRQGVLEVVCCGTRSSSSVRARTPPVQHLLRGGYKLGLHAFQGGRRHHGRFGTPVLATPLRGMLYADNAGVVSRSPEQLRKMMDGIVVVCAVFGLTVSEAKTEIMCLRARGMSDSTAVFSVEAEGLVYNQTNEFVYLGGNVNHNADLSIEVDRRISFRKYTLELYDRPSAPLELKSGC